MKRFHARVEVVKKLKAKRLFVETKHNPMQIPICRSVVLSTNITNADFFPSKSGDVIEPVLKPQWWVNCKPLAEEAINVSWKVLSTDQESTILYSAPELASLTFNPSNLKMNGIGGLKVFRIGVFLDSCGGVIAVRLTLLILKAKSKM